MSEVNEKEIDLKKALADLEVHNEKQTKGAIDAYGEKAKEAMEGEVNKLSDEIAELKTAMNRQATVADAVEEAKDDLGAAYVKALRDYVVSDIKSTEFNSGVGFNVLSTKAALNTGDADGLQSVQQSLQLAITKTLYDMSPMRQIADVQLTDTAVYTRIFDIGGATAQWVGETDPRVEQTRNSLKKVVIPAKTIATDLRSTQEMIEDAYFDVVNWITTSGAEAIALAESTAFVRGAGTNEPIGFLDSSVLGVADAADAWGVYSVKDTVDIGVLAYEDIVVLPLNLATGYSNNGKFAMSRQIAAQVRLIKDTEGNSIWAPGLGATPDTLLGNEIVYFEDMDKTVTAGNDVIAFGDFKKGYGISDRTGLTMLRDQYTAYPNTAFKMAKRIGGGVLDTKAVVVLRVRTAA